MDERYKLTDGGVDILIPHVIDNTPCGAEHLGSYKE